VHIATHGFHLPFQDHSDLDSIINNNSTYEDDMLQRCGLVFAGANNVALGNRNIPDDIEDGILSASEIANLDLFNTELVVMSACQTGLGMVGDDGVFGLQRAFKKAGAQSVMMTLWSVDDKVTQKLMTEFYKGLMYGLSKYDALKNAQQQIRQMTFTNSTGERHSGNNPYYWAPFVILD
jgi:CHAT domain-containing protein